MECRKQGFWKFAYHEYKNILCDSTANHNYAQFAKQQYHKARRRYDKKLIQQGLKLWHTKYDGLSYPIDIYTPCFEYFLRRKRNWKEHNHKIKPFKTKLNNINE